MAATAQLQAERAELDAILRSGIFHRAPNLAIFLRYVCDRYFEGDADKLKEYSIAVEALGRPPDFDQKKDSIVRVEAHRLRKRLAEYYATEGASHAVRIVIPNGQYAPRFLYKESDPISGEILPANLTLQSELVPAGTPIPPPNSLPSPAVVEFSPKKSGSKRLRWLIAAVSGLAVLATAVAWRVTHSGPNDHEVWQGSFAEPVAGEFRFLAGYHGSPFRDRQGRLWQPDAFYTGGISLPVRPSRTIEGVPDPGFVRSYREGNFHYDIPVVEGTYELHLYFAETQYGDGNPGGGAVNTRLFKVYLNGRPVLDLFDALSEAGAPNRLHSRVFRDVTPAADGKVHMVFEKQSGSPMLSALELLPSSPGRVRPIRIVTSQSSVVDTQGSMWLADQFAVGGTQVERHTVANGPLKMLFVGERYGNFAYHIPVPPGKYRLRLYFAETFFGSKLSYAGTATRGQRVFNVFANGVALLRDFDVTEEAGGINKPLVKVFTGLEPNAQGKIVLEFVPVRNYAQVNAIEITQEE